MTLLEWSNTESWGPTQEATADGRRVGTVSWTVSRADVSEGTPWVLRMNLIGGRHESKHATVDAAKEHAEKVFDRHLRSFGYVPKEEADHNGCIPLEQA